MNDKIFNFVNNGIEIKKFDNDKLEVFIHNVKFDYELKPEVWPSDINEIVLDFSLESIFRFLENNSLEQCNTFFSKLPDLCVTLRTSDMRQEYVREQLKKIKTLNEKVNYIELNPHYHLNRVGFNKKECRIRYIDFSYNDHITKKFIFLNRSVNYARSLLLNKILKNDDLMEDSYISWLNRFNSKSPIKEKLVLDDRLADHLQHFYPQQYRDALVDIFCETNAVERGFDPPMITEKTWRPLLAGHIFLGFGYQGLYSYLESCGFKIYHEIFNYSFDTINSLDERLEAYFQCLEEFYLNYKNVDNRKLYTSLREKINHNKNVALALAHKTPIQRVLI